MKSISINLCYLLKDHLTVLRRNFNILKEKILRRGVKYMDICGHIHSQIDGPGKWYVYYNGSLKGIAYAD